jgi:murein DD-endopeptidase MepM/ murein hydrolase activator NlpD
MRINTSLRFLVIAGAFLSAETTLARNSLSNVQVLVANNTLKTQLLGTNRFANPAPLNAQAPETANSQDTASNIIASDSPPAEADATRTQRLSFGTLRERQRVKPVATVTATPVKNSTSQFGFDDDQGVANSTKSLPSQNLSARSTQIGVLSSDVANIEQNSKISVVPTQSQQPEASVVIPVPLPRTQIVPVQSVTRLPRIVKSNSIPSVTILPTVRPGRTISPTPNATVFATNVANQSSGESIYPLLNPAPMTSRFGWRTHPLTGSRRFHSGIDIGAPAGTPVVATGSGTVVSAGWNGGYGKAIVIQHNDTQQTLYGHLSEISVQAGQEIAQGTVIGLVGSTGNSTGPHLHYESRVPNADGWVAVDPTPEIQYAVDNLRRSLPYARKDLPQGL